MKVVPQVEITDARLVSTTVPDLGPGEVAWVSDAACAVNDERVRVTTGRKYSRLIAGAGSVPPESDPVNWKDIGASNKKAMFDLYRNSRTEAVSPLTVVMAPGKRVDTLALTGMIWVTAAEVVVRVGTEIVYTRTINLRNL